MPIDVSSYSAGWRERAAREELERERRRQETAARLKPIVERFAAEFAVRRVILFGSRAFGRERPGSDVDLAVEGLAPERYFAAFRFLERELGADLVDLVEYEVAGATLRQRIEEGIVLLG